MNNFDFHVPTDIRFGKGQIECLPEELSKYGKKVLLTYGGGSIKKTGIYDRVMELLKDFEVYELSGIEPNPKITSVREGVAICKDKGIDVILAVGGKYNRCFKAYILWCLLSGGSMGSCKGQEPCKKGAATCSCSYNMCNRFRDELRCSYK